MRERVSGNTQVVGKSGTIVIMLWNRVQLSRLPITKYVNTASLSTVRFENAKPFKSIPGPISFPGMGSGYYMFKKDYRDHHDQLYIKLYKRYGPLIRLNLFGVNTLVIADPHDAAEMFLHEGDYPDMPSLTMIVGFQRALRKDLYPDGRGLLGSNGEEWWAIRSKVNQDFTRPESAFFYTEKIEQISGEFVEHMAASRDSNQELPASFNEMDMWALESLGVVFLDQRLNAFDPKVSGDPNSDVNRLLHGIQTFVKHFLDLRVTAFAWTKLPKISYRFREFDDSQVETYHITKKMVDKAKAKIDVKSLYATTSSEQMSVLAKMMKRCGPDSSIPTQMAMEALLGGVDNTANTATYFLYNLAIRPEIQKKLYQEIKEVVGNKPLTPALINELRYLNACLRESMRLLPGTGGMERTAPKNLVLRGYQVPKGTNMMFAEQAMGYLHFPDPEDFIPERWMRGHKLFNTVPPFSALPFGHGRRKCIGMRLAVLEIQVLTVKVLQRFEISYNHAPIQTLSRVINIPNLPPRFKLVERN